jgi:hypothetical protein
MLEEGLDGFGDVGLQDQVFDVVRALLIEVGTTPSLQHGCDDRFRAETLGFRRGGQNSVIAEMSMQGEGVSNFELT